MSYSSAATPSSHNNGMEDEVMGSRSAISNFVQSLVFSSVFIFLYMFSFASSFSLHEVALFNKFFSYLTKKIKISWVHVKKRKNE